jgi:hypothetical protein
MAIELLVIQWEFLYRDIVVVVLMVGPISTAAMRAYCTLTPNGVPSFIFRGAAHQAA